MCLKSNPQPGQSVIGGNCFSKKPPLTIGKLSLIAGLVIILGACDGDGTISLADNNVDEAITEDNTASDAVVPRFGTRTTRNLTPESDANTESEVINGFNDLSLQLLREQRESEPGENTVNSGYSLAVALAMLQRGTANGDFNQIQQLLGVSAINETALYSAMNAIDLNLESRSNDGLELKSANQLFVKPGFTLDTDFMDVMTSEFDAPISDAKFQQAPDAVREAINEWASENTNDLIPELLQQPLPTSTVLAILNATLLDAKWNQEFTDVPNHQFTNIDGETQSVAGFGGTDNFRFLETDDAMSVSIDYMGSDVSMMIIVPNDIETYIASLTTAEISQRHTDASNSYLALTVPNWEITSNIEFTSLPMTEGLVDRMLNLTRMAPAGDCCEITSFKQQAIIEVDKDGTRAAAVTSISVGTTSVGILPVPVKIDQPFLYFIRDEPTGLVLFSGQVLGL